MNKPLREHYETPTDAGSMLQTFRYIDDLEKYIEYLEHKPAQLQQHSVVRGGVIEAQSLPLRPEDLEWVNSCITQITPTRCPRCKSTNILDTDDHWTHCQNCGYSFVGG